MILKNITVIAHPDGNCVNISWENPAPDLYPGILVKRREKTHPLSPDNPLDGTIVIQGEGITSFRDAPLKGETVYYYSFFPYRGDPPQYIIDRRNRAVAMATAPYDHAGQLFALLPGIYHRYDKSLPKNPPDIMAEADKTRGQLRRFLDLPGSQLDMLFSRARAMQHFHDVDKVDGRLLPLLAQWIGWQSNLGLEYDAQRNEIRHAPEIYKTVGILANLRALVNRITGWDSQIKEFMYNVFRSNDPERLNTWSQTLSEGEWREAELVSLDYAYEGKSTTFRDSQERQWLFYHTESNGRWHIRYKIFDRGKWSKGYHLGEGKEIEKYPCALQLRDRNICLFRSCCSTGSWAIKSTMLSAGRNAFAAQLISENSEPFALFDGAALTAQIDNGAERTVTFQSGDFETINAATAAEVVKVLNRELFGAAAFPEAGGSIVLSSDTAGAESALQIIAATSTAAPVLGFNNLTAAPGQDATQAELIGWRQAPYSLTEGDQLVIRMGQNTTVVTFYEADFPGGMAAATLNSVLAVLNRSLSGVTAAATAGNTIRLVSEATGENALLSIDIDVSSAASPLGFGAALPAGSTSNREPSAFTDSDQNLWLFWSARENKRWQIHYNKFTFAGADWGWRPASKALASSPDNDCEPSALFFSDTDPARQIWVFWSRKTQIGWHIHLATKPDRDFDLDNWGFENPFLPPESEHKEAAAGLDAQGNIRLFWSANRKDGWNIYSRVFNAAAGAWGEIIAATSGYFSKRYPAFWEDDRGNIRLMFRSNKSVAYNSQLYPTTVNYDHRYAGATAVDTANTAKNSLRGDLDDIRKYTYDTGKKNEHWYARDTIGVYLYPNTENEELINRGKEIVQGVFNRFLPVQLRAVFIILPFVYEDFVYTYDHPQVQPQRLIAETFADEIAPPASDIYSGLNDTVIDQMPNWLRMRTWSVDFSDHRTVDFAAAVINTNDRTWHVGLDVEYD